MKKIFSEFRDFAFRGNVIDLAVGVMIGGAFSKIVSSLVSDLFMPIIALITGGFDFTNLFIALDGKTYQTLNQAKEAGAATLNYGVFLTQVIDFLLMAFCVFLFVKLIGKLKNKLITDKPIEIERKCPYCFEIIPKEALRCPHCTSELTAVIENKQA
ncbi:MAG: large conductance mechanosensitive channel protein MscL [Clostridia bacterium]